MGCVPNATGIAHEKDFCGIVNLLEVQISKLDGASLDFQ
jgi:hypothetical protein